MVEWGEGYAPLLGPNGCFRRCARIGLMFDFGWFPDARRAGKYLQCENLIST